MNRGILRGIFELSHKNIVSGRTHQHWGSGWNNKNIMMWEGQFSQFSPPPNNSTAPESCERAHLSDAVASPCVWVLTNTKYHWFLYTNVLLSYSFLNVIYYCVHVSFHNSGSCIPTYSCPTVFQIWFIVVPMFWYWPSHVQISQYFADLQISGYHFIYW